MFSLLYLSNHLLYLGLLTKLYIQGLPHCEMNICNYPLATIRTLPLRVSQEIQSSILSSKHLGWRVSFVKACIICSMWLFTLFPDAYSCTKFTSLRRFINLQTALILPSFSSIKEFRADVEDMKEPLREGKMKLAINKGVGKEITQFRGWSEFGKEIQNRPALIQFSER